MQSQPKVIFEINQRQDIDTIWHFLNGNQISTWYFNTHPKLKGIMEGDGDKKKLVFEYLNDFYASNKAPIEKALKSIRFEWDKINDNVMANLSEILEREWKVKQIHAQLTITGICWVDQDENWFSVYYKSNTVEMKKTAIHELIHLLYFKKWQEIFPKDDRSKFEMPSKIWALSEILAIPISNDKRLKACRGIVSENSYKQYFGETELGRKKVMLTDYFENLYKEQITEKKVPFAEFLGEARRTMDQIRDKKLTA